MGGCWCMFYRLPTRRYEEHKGEGNRLALKALVDGGRPPGLLAYDGDEAVAWIAVAPRGEYSRLSRSRILKPVDSSPVWSIVCTFVRQDHRRQGLSLRLVRGAVDWAASQGARIIEAYPLDVEIRRLSRRLCRDGLYAHLCRGWFQRSDAALAAAPHHALLCEPRRDAMTDCWQVLPLTPARWPDLERSLASMARPMAVGACGGIRPMSSSMPMLATTTITALAALVSEGATPGLRGLSRRRAGGLDLRAPPRGVFAGGRHARLSRRPRPSRACGPSPAFYIADDARGQGWMERLIAAPWPTPLIMARHGRRGLSHRSRSGADGAL